MTTCLLLPLAVPGAETISPAKAPEMIQAPVPGWVEPVEARLLPGGYEAGAELNGDGVFLALVDQRVNVGARTRYFRRVKQITATHGLADASKISVNFDPEYQRLEWHAIRLIRNGTEISRLSLNQIEMSRRYQELEWNIYDSSVTAFAVVDDLRVGDVIDWEYSIIGFNPVYGDRFAELTYLSWTVPAGRAVVEYRLPAGRTVAVRTWNGVSEAATVRTGTETIHRWTMDDIAAVDYHWDAPATWNPFARVQVSEFDSWAEVVTWAELLYPAVAIETAMVRDIISEDTEWSDDVLGVAKRLLQFVQEDVRYLSVAAGESSHRPSPPPVTLERRFGDCKDKAYLYCMLLRSAGIRAVPVLVNTGWRDGIADLLPMPNAFDHVIVRIDLPDGGHRWVDPTRNHQGGPVTERVIGALKLGLPVAPGVVELEAIIPAPATASVTQVEENFSIRGFKDSVDLRVTSIYRGVAADEMRARIATTRRREMSQGFVEFYATDYPQVEEATPFEVDDDRELNRLTLREHYRIDDFWVRSKAGEPYQASFYPNAVRQFVNRPTAALRGAPYALQHPLEISQKTTVHLPEEWSGWRSSERVANEFLAVETSAEVRGRNFTYTASMKTLAEKVPGNAVPAFARDVDRALQELGYELTWLPAEERGGVSNPNWLRILLTPVVFFGPLAAFVFWATRLQHGPPIIRGPTGPEGLGGWLILVVVGFAVGLVLRLVYLVDAAPTFYDTTVWNTAVASANPAWQWMLEWCFWGEFIFGYACLAATAAFFVFFFWRHRALPRIALSALVLNLLDTASGSVGLFLLPDIEIGEQSLGVRNLISSTLGAGIWTTYFLVSRRVRNTFRR